MKIYLKPVKLDPTLPFLFVSEWKAIIGEHEFPLVDIENSPFKNEVVLRIEKDKIEFGYPDEDVPNAAIYIETQELFKSLHK